MQISNCYFDANFGPGMMFVGPESRPGLLSVTGNIIRDSGWSRTRAGRPPQPAENDCQVFFRDCLGLAFTGNSVLACKQGEGITMPSRGLVIEKLTDSVIVGNSFFHSATKEWLVDGGGHQNTVIANNAGSLVKLGAYPELF